MEKFLKLYKAYQREKQSLQLDIGHNKYCGWCIQVLHNDSNTNVVNVQHESLEIAVAQAFLELEEWAKEYEDLEDIVYNIF